MDRIELRLKMEAETKKASDNENGTRTDVSEEYVKWLEQQVKNCSIPDVVHQREQFKSMVFDMANKMALAGLGDEAVSMHRIHNRL